jgi:IS5 family transposase
MRIVEALDVIEHICPSRVPRAIDVSIDPLRFQGTKEALHRGVIPAIASATHAAGNAFLLEQRLEVVAGVSGNWYSYRNQVFTGETYLQTEPPIDPSSLTRWRKRLGEAGVEELLAETIEAAKRAGVIKTVSVKRVIVDTTVMQKAVAHPTDSRLLERCREHLVKAAARHGLKLRQNYNREAPYVARQIDRYAHAKQFKRMKKALRTLRSRVGRVMRDVERQLDSVSDTGRSALTELIDRTRRIPSQK